jgi:uncharacterized protein (DUF2225 family)
MQPLKREQYVQKSALSFDRVYIKDMGGHVFSIRGIEMNEIYYNKKIICPVCSTHFKGTKIKKSMLHNIKTDTDLCRYFKDANPYYYDINVCPECGFSFSDSFEKKLSTAEIDKFLKSITARWKKQDLCGERSFEQAVDSLKMALLCGQVIGLKEINLAGICLRLCWLYREKSMTEEEKRFMKAAVGFYEKAYEMQGLNDEKEMRPELVVYLIGELNFRLGNFKDSVKWFNLAISRYSRDPAVKKQTMNMIKDRWMEIKDAMK